MVIRVGSDRRDLDRCPTAYHGEDYKNLLGAQKNILEDLCDAVFGNPAFYYTFKLYVQGYGSNNEIKNMQKCKQVVLDATEYIKRALLFVLALVCKDIIILTSP